MPAQDQATRTLSSKLAAVERWHPTADTSELRRDLRAARVQAYIERVLAEMPPLTDAQREDIAALLRPARRGATAA